MHILITGSAGFIASHLVDHILGLGHSVTGIDNFITGSPKNIEQLKGNRVNRCAIRIKESLKMAYVGMSRPTDLLCVAFHKTRIPSNEIPFLQNNWEIVDLTLN